ncbi:hypothetical protein ABW20_dc0103067 [Dactylellina cionopaga]|nr:hypothetical protein ABW20_dc0103067 [Dactylellina cionopaga]
MQATVPLDFLWRDTAETENGYEYDDAGFTFRKSSDNHFWRATPPAVLPTFAEYAVKPSAALEPAVVDTGITIRSFLPFAESEARQRLSRYRGKALVWDARVVCQKPRVSNVKFLNDGIFVVSGDVQNSVQLDIIEESQPTSIPFFCQIPSHSYYFNDRPIICQLPTSDNNYAGGLKSKFSGSDRTVRTGAAYLVLNRTSLNIENYLNENPEWGKVSRITPMHDGPKDQIQSDEMVIGTLCYSAMDAVDQTVDIWTSKPQNEPAFPPSLYDDSYDAASFNQQLKEGLRRDGYNFDKILPRFLSNEAEGLLHLEQPDSGWAAVESVRKGSDGPWANSNLSKSRSQHFLPRHIDLTSPAQTGVAGNHSLYFSDITDLDTEYSQKCGAWLGDLYVATKEHGNAALALQAVLTVVASNIYYEYLPAFDRSAEVTMALFQNVASPGGQYGTRRGSGDFPVGFTRVAILFGLQMTLAVMLLIRFRSREGSKGRLPL